ncbi:hypothetical protein FSO04_44220 [Paraburkholderia madseniana]|uniref:Uncharacterized protein n=1 Tax=Paraburkholderia madseniana TaxID=2599607 RepID=A0A6N6W197_9BURK|nr:hypothetical protein [Paraburkholderia madseniana]KAE8753608.1 hypothetical protein FSO04_44220 [Paraburkholderia madseniana]
MKTLEDQYIELYVTGKPRDMLWIERFAPSDVGMVVAEQDGVRFVFSGSEKLVEWVAQLKPSHVSELPMRLAIHSRVLVSSKLSGFD